MIIKWLGQQEEYEWSPGDSYSVPSKQLDVLEILPCWDVERGLKRSKTGAKEESQDFERRQSQAKVDDNLN